MSGQDVNLIMITPHGRSGSLFLQSLFDGHPQLVTIPDISLNYQLDTETLDVEKYIDNFLKNNPQIVDSSQGYLGQIGTNVTKLFGFEGKNNLWHDAQLLKERVLARLRLSKSDHGQRISRKKFWIDFHFAYAEMLGMDVRKIKYIVFHQHDYRTFSHQSALDDFPNMFYFAMIRDPREDWNSWKKVLELRKGSLSKLTYRYDLYANVRQYSRYIAGLYDFSQNFKTRHLVTIDLNKFHLKNHCAMEAISRLLEIDFKPSLLLSTFNGQMWSGNSADRTAITGFDLTKSALKWKIDLQQSEALLIERMLSSEIKFLGYEISPLTGQFRPRYPFFSSLLSSLSSPIFSKKTIHEEVGTFRRIVKVAKAIARALFFFPIKVRNESWNATQEEAKKDKYLTGKLPNFSLL